MDLMERLGGTLNAAWQNLTAGVRPSHNPVAAPQLEYSHALGITLHTVSVEAVGAESSEPVASSTSIGWGPRTIAEVGIPDDLAENLRWVDSSGQKFALIPSQDPIYANLVSDQPIEFTDALQSKVRVLMKWPEPQILDLGVVEGWDPHFG